MEALCNREKDTTVSHTIFIRSDTRTADGMKTMSEVMPADSTLCHEVRFRNQAASDSDLAVRLKGPYIYILKPKPRTSKQSKFKVSGSERDVPVMDGIFANIIPRPVG